MNWHFEPYVHVCPVFSAMFGHPYLVLKHGTVSFSFCLVNLFQLLGFLKIIQKMTKNRVLIIYGISWLIPFWTQRDMETFKSQLNYVQTNKVTLKNLLSTSFLRPLRLSTRKNLYPNGNLEIWFFSRVFLTSYFYKNRTSLFLEHRA